MGSAARRDRFESVELRLLRARYRCTLCHKHCDIPCQFTAAEFRRLAQELDEAPTDEDPPDWVA